MVSFSDLLVVGLGLFLFVGLLRLFGVRRISGLVFLVLLFVLLLLGTVGWAYWEWHRTQTMPLYQSEWKNGRLEDLQGNPVDPESFTGPDLTP